MKFAPEFLEYCLNSRNFRASTVETYGNAIRDFERTVGIDDPTKVTIRDLDAWMTAKALAGIAPTTRRGRGYALRAFFRYLKSRRIISEDPTRDFRPPADDLAVVPTFSEAEIRRLVFFKPKEPVRGGKERGAFYARRCRIARLCGARDSAILALSYSLGLRSGEVGKIRIDDLKANASGELLVSLRGKGAREQRPFYVDRKVGALVDDFLIAARDAGIRSSAVFPPIEPRRRGGVPTEEGIGQSAVGRLFAKRLADTRIEARGRKLTPHVLRYSLATHLYDQRVDLLEIQRFLRHRSVGTTQRYIRLGSSRSSDRRIAGKLSWNRPLGSRPPDEREPD
jgi:site-specific recombinase XerD